MKELQDFKIYLSSEKGLSPRSIEAYLTDLRKLSDFVGGKTLSLLTDEELLNFFLKERDVSASSTTRRRFMSIKVFFKFLKTDGIISKDPFKFLTSPKMWQKVPVALQEREMELLLKQPDITTYWGLRDRAILEILYGTGIRVSELVGLTVYSIDEEGIRVMGKGSKERVVPIGKEALKALDLYLGARVGGGERGDPLFLNKKGKPIDRIEVWEMVKSYGKMAGLQKRVSPHTLRHSYATHLLSRGADVRIIQELLGHGAISSTERYTQVSMKQLKEKFNVFHPANDGI